MVDYIDVLRVPYRFAVGTISGAVGWGTYVAVPVLGYLGYQNFAKIKSYSVDSYDTIRSNHVKKLPDSEVIAEKVSMVYNNAPGLFDRAYQFCVASFNKVKHIDAPKSLFDNKPEGSEDSSGTPSEVISGAISVLQNQFSGVQNKLEERIGSLDQYVPAAKMLSGAFVAHQLGLFETASFVSKQAEMTVESWFGVSGDAYGLFDLPYAIGGVSKTAIATFSKVPHVVGFVVGGLVSLVGPAFVFSTVKYAKQDSEYSVSGYTDHLRSDISVNKAYYGAATSLFAAYNYGGILEVSQSAGKGSELAFEHAFGLSGDTIGLFDAEFYS